jgi:hypothetical protein
MHHLTDMLLTTIEDNPTWKVAFGFDKGDTESVPTTGKKLKDHHCTIATRLFLDPKVPFKDFTNEDLPKLADAVKNRINVYVSTTFFFVKYSIWSVV